MSWRRDDGRDDDMDEVLARIVRNRLFIEDGAKFITDLGRLLMKWCDEHKTADEWAEVEAMEEADAARHVELSVWSSPRPSPVPATPPLSPFDTMPPLDDPTSITGDAVSSSGGGGGGGGDCYPQSIKPSTLEHLFPPDPSITGKCYRGDAKLHRKPAFPREQLEHYGCPPQPPSPLQPPQPPPSLPPSLSTPKPRRSIKEIMEQSI